MSEEKEKREISKDQYYPIGKKRYVTVHTYAKLCGTPNPQTIYARLNSGKVKLTILEEVEGYFIDLKKFPPVEKIMERRPKGKLRKEKQVTIEFNLEEYIKETSSEIQKQIQLSEGKFDPYDMKRILAERYQIVKDKITFQEFCDRTIKLDNKEKDTNTNEKH